MTDPVSDEQLAEWERRFEAATDGVWYVQRRGGERLELRAAWPDEDLRLATVKYLSDADFIVHAHIAVPLLLRALRDARAENQRVIVANEALRTGRVDGDAESAAVEWRHTAEQLAAERDALRAESQRMHSHLAEILAKHSRYRAPAEGRFDCCAECNRGSVLYVPYPCSIRTDLEAALDAPTGQEQSR